MKKFLALLLAVLMIASMSVTAFAADATAAKNDGLLNANVTGDNVTNVTNTANTSATQNVYVVSTGLTDTDVVYYVIVEWQALNFTYQFAESTTWNPATHKYENGQAAAGTWYVGTGDTKVEGYNISDAIVVENHSNAVVWVQAAFAGAEEKENLGVTAKVTGSAGYTSLANAEGTEFADAANAKYSVSVSGTPEQKDAFILSTITVTVATTDPTANG